MAFDSEADHVIDRQRQRGADVNPESQLPGRAIPSIANQTGSAQGDYGHGSPARAAGLPDVEIRPGVSRQGHTVL